MNTAAMGWKSQAVWTASTLLGLLALAAAVWWLGPLIAIAGTTPLGSAPIRALVIALLVMAWMAQVLIKMWTRRRANALLLNGIVSSSIADEEALALSQRFREAVAKLRSAPGNKSRFGISRGLYELPWYVFIGAPGAGKTTALLNAGLQFVLADDGAAVKGVGGTRNCDWWFTGEAVLIDTAGRFALQESERKVDASAWGNFLSLLRQTRPRRPINGVLLTVSIPDLLQRSEVERGKHATKLRARLDELQAILGVRPPVYVMVTKTDLIAGFSETFEAIGKAEREQVWGFTFDAAIDSGDRPLRYFADEYQSLVRRLSEGLGQRMQVERDGARRAAMFGFVQEFASLQSVLGEFLGHAFGSAGRLQEAVKLRGVYFTSGTQEGTPIDRVMGQLSRSYGLERDDSAPHGAQGKSFFLRQLLQDVVFPEAHLVSFNANVERRLRLARFAGFTASLIAGSALCAGWALSYRGNLNYSSEIAARLPALRQAVDALPPLTHADPAVMVGPLEAVHDAAHVKAFSIDAPPLLRSLGLYQGDKLDAAAQQAYRRLLEHVMLPRVARRLEDRLRQVNRDNLEQAYETLKAYLMLYTPGKFNAEELGAWITVDWNAQLDAMAPAQRAALDGHLRAMLALGAPRSAPPLDEALVKEVREMLVSYPLEYRVYSYLKRQFEGSLPDFTVAAASGPYASKVFERISGQPLSRGVSGFHTRDGYAKVFGLMMSHAAARLTNEEPWVLGQERSGVGIAKPFIGKELGDRVRRLYLQDYVKAYDDILADVQLLASEDPLDRIEVARLLSGIDSPLTAWVRAIVQETTLIPPAKVTDALSAVTDAAQSARDTLARLVDAPASRPVGSGPLEQIVDDHFAPLHRLVAGRPSRLDAVPGMFAAVHTYLRAVAAAQRGKLESPPPLSEAVLAAAAQEVEPIRSMFESLAEAGSRQGQAVERASLTSELKPGAALCARAVANRYPFAATATSDVLPEDFGELFGVDGTFDLMFKRRLAPLVDTSVRPWKYKALADGVRPASSAALLNFERAAMIRDAFFKRGGKSPAFRVEVRVVEWSDGLDSLFLDIDGQVHKFDPASDTALAIAWPGTPVSSRIKMYTTMQDQAQTFEGPWALFRFFDRFEIQRTAQPEKFAVLVHVDGKRARLEVTASSVINPFQMPEMQLFRCPGA